MFKELIRVLKPGGSIIMTLPFGNSFRLVLGNEARCYCSASIKRFQVPEVKCLGLEVYEYQPINKLSTSLKNKLKYIMQRMVGCCEQPGQYIWRKLKNPSECKAEFRWHVDGVALTTWIKVTNN